jgi:ferredoxin
MRETPAYSRALIYFMSGTGNSFRIAVWMRTVCRREGIEAELVRIDAGRPREEITASPDTLLILAYPTHGLLPPWSMIKFLFKLPVKRRTRVFWTPTRGSFCLGRLFIPGAAGLASFLPVLVLAFKGYRLKGMVSFDMPANMISIHSRLSDRNIDRIKRKAKGKLEKNFERVLSGKSIWWTLNNLYELIWSVVLLRFWPLFPLLYLVLGRFFMGQMMFANNRCVGCGLCAASCPNQALVMKGRRKPRPYWKYNCEDCLRCMNFCPQQAVEVGHSWGVLLFFAASFPLSFTIFDLLVRYLPFLERFRGYSAVELVNSVYTYPAVMLAYFIFFWLIRWKPLNQMFTYTTFTHLFRRFHDPETELSDLTGKL